MLIRNIVDNLKKNRLLFYFGAALICVLLFIFFFYLGTKVHFKNAFADSAPRGTVGDKWADIVLGQTDLTQAIPKSTVAFKVGNPGGTWVDRSIHPNIVYVSDSLNS